ncbi:hypothetical protein [Sporosarcina sp. E16_8]|uniref:hypothetical protein n=1 Tax=Sporosarcina sp. E16_8 TaxID=2789295 RepID=UPI001A91D41F|nr:hypothetical protein [Sporosarcina sp. E16_8]MBO0589148.1 hypothetical protein [Sporosarcina sp. E16_8]
MGDSKLYTAHDIEKLKQKVATYKDTLTTLTIGNSIDDYLFKKTEFNGFTTQVSNLEGVIEKLNEKQSTQIVAHEQQVKSFSVQINSLNQTVKELNKDISLIRNKIKNDTSNIFKEHINAQAEVQDSAIIANNEKRVENFIEVTTQTKDQTSISSFQQSNRPPSIMNLQSLVAKATNIQEAPSDVTPVSSLSIQKKYQEGQQYTKQSFPSTGVNPSQLYNGRNRNVPITSGNHQNKIVKKHRIPIRVIENSAVSSTSSIFEKNEKVTEYFDEVNNVAPIEMVNAPIVIYDEVSDVTPIDLVNASIEICDEVSDVTPIEVVSASIEIYDVVSDVTPIVVVNDSIEIYDEVNDVTPIEVVNASIEIYDEVNDVTLIEVVNASIEIYDEVNDVTPIEVVNASIEIYDKVNHVAPIEISNEMKRQQHKNKETFWLFNLFSKKH